MRPFRYRRDRERRVKHVGSASSAPNTARPRTLSWASTRGISGTAPRSSAKSPLLGDHQGVGDRSGAQLDPETVLVRRLGTLQRSVAGVAGSLRRQRPADECLLGVAGAPWPRGETADGDAGIAHRVALHSKATAAEARAKA